MQRRIGCVHVFIFSIVLILIFEFLSKHTTEILIFAAGCGIISVIISLYKANKKNKTVVVEEEYILHAKPHAVKTKDNPRVTTSAKAEFFTILQKTLLDSSVHGYLFDILVDIKTIKQNSIENRQHSVHKVSDSSILEKEYKDALLHDICQMSVLLEIDMNTESLERNIALSAFAFFTLNELDYKNLIENRQNVQLLLAKFLSIINTSQSCKDEDKILGTKLFINYKSDYLSKIVEIVTLITTIDYKLTGKENKVIEFYKHYF